MLDNSIAERKIEDRYERINKNPYELELDDDNVQLNVDQQSYGGKSNTDYSDKVTKTRRREITKAYEILEQALRMIKENSIESE